MNLSRRLARLRVPLGFACGVAVAWLARPTWRTLAVGLPIAFAGEVLRVWAAGHLEKSREVTQSGPYRYFRHPLYVGSSVMAAGLAIACGDLAVAILVGIYMVTTITAAVRTENEFLRRTFGEDYQAWREGRGPRASRRFSSERAIRNREYRAVLGLLIGAALLVIKVLAFRE
ncbi:MAG TPA: methyltransferase [Vicinamibacterales bacterium]